MQAKIVLREVVEVHYNLNENDGNILKKQGTLP